MFERPNVPKKEKGILEKTTEGIRAAVAGATLLGAVGATGLPVETAGMQSRAEAQESFDFERETTAFIDTIASLEAGIDDAHGRHLLRTLVEQKFSTFALAAANRTPYYSAGGDVSLNGAVTYEMRAAAGKYLSSRLPAASADNAAIEILRELVTGESSRPDLSTVPGERPAASNNDGLGLQKSEVRRRQGDW